MSRGGSGSGRKHNLSFTETVKFKDKNTKSVPSVPLTTFETTLRNITSADELIFSGDAVEEYSSETKKKLSTGSNDYVVSPTTKDVRNIISIEERTKGAMYAECLIGGRWHASQSGVQRRSCYLSPTDQGFTILLSG